MRPIQLHSGVLPFSKLQAEDEEESWAEEEIEFWAWKILEDLGRFEVDFTDLT